MKKDHSDLQKFCDWFHSHNLFFSPGEIIMCKYWCVGCWKHQLCNKPREILKTKMTDISSNNFKDLRLLTKKNRVMPLRSVNCSVKINCTLVPVDPDTIFWMTVFHIKSQEQLESYFGFEFAAYPLSRFNNGGNQHFYKLFNPVNSMIPKNATIVIDGGFLLHAASVTL